jgi:hypothetical protein
LIARRHHRAAAQGLIPDLVPQDRRGRFSGIKAILEVPVPIILVAFTVAKLIGAGNMWGGILVALMLIVGVFILVFALISGWLSDRFSH